MQTDLVVVVLSCCDIAPKSHLLGLSGVVLVFNSAFGRHTNKLISSTLSSLGVSTKKSPSGIKINSNRPISVQKSTLSLVGEG